MQRLHAVRCHDTISTIQPMTHALVTAPEEGILPPAVEAAAIFSPTLIAESLVEILRSKRGPLPLFIWLDVL